MFCTYVIITSRVPINKSIRPLDEVMMMKSMMKWWWNLWWNSGETAWKCLACMIGCWDPEFEPSVEEIVDYRWDMAILSDRFLWQARTRGDFPVQSSTWQVEVTSGSAGSSCVPQYTRVRSMRSLSTCPSSNYGGVFSWGTLDVGSKFFIKSLSGFNISWQIMQHLDSHYPVSCMPVV